MEVDEIQTPQPCEFSRVNSNGRIESSTHKDGGGPSGTKNHKNETVIRRAGPTTTNPNSGEVVGSHRFRHWPHSSSRIIRVSRASGGKDRHSKVWTAKGPRDRRVRLSVTTAIQFYDLQDRLGYDQPSKAVEWLIKAAADAINELPSLNSTFPLGTPSDERRASGGGVVADSEFDGEINFGQNNQQQQQQQQVGSLSKSGCSSNNSETSKGSVPGPSLSRSEIRVKARERARARTAKEKERESEPHQQHLQQQQQNNVSSMTHTSSFTQLLTAGISNLNESKAATSLSPSARHENARSGNNIQWLSSASTTPMDYFGSGYSPSQIQVGNTSLPQLMTISSFAVGGSENNQHHPNHELHHQHFSFLPDPHLIQASNTAVGAGSVGSDYNLNFTISSSSTTSGLAAGFNRGTLQSNSPSLLPYLQRFSATDGTGTCVPFFRGGAAVSSATPNVENQHHHHQHHNHHHQHHNHHHQQFQPPGLQLCYGDGGPDQPDQRGKGKN